MVAFAITDRDGTISTNTVTATLTIGADGGTDWLLVGVYGRRAASPPLTLSGVTIDGVAASVDASASIPLGDGNAGSVAAIAMLARSALPDPSQTDVDVVATFGANLSTAASLTIGVADEEIEFHDSDAGTIPNTGSGTGTATHDLTVDIASGGVALGVAGVRATNTATTTWAVTGLTEVNDVVPTGGGVKYVDAFLSNGSLESNRAVQFAATDSASSMFDSTGVVASYRAVAAGVPEPASRRMGMAGGMTGGMH